jgi:hypothetical protein
VVPVISAMSPNVPGMRADWLPWRPDAVAAGVRAAGVPPWADEQPASKKTPAHPAASRTRGLVTVILRFGVARVDA